MKNRKKILYIGNNLTKKTKYNTTLILLSNLLQKESFQVIISSDKINKLYRLVDMSYAVFKCRKKVDYILIDTYSTSNFYYALITSQLARIFKIKYIPILHGGNLPERLRSNTLLSSLIFKNSYKNIAPSNYLKEAFEGYGYKTEFIPNILEIENYNYKIRKIIKPRLLWVRAFKEIYNPTMAIRVLKLLKKKFPDATLCMVGPFVDDTYEQTKKLINKFNLQDSVELTGVLLKEQWHKRSEEFDIFINTTNFDNTPVSVMEAMALGLPIVSTNVGGLPFLIKDKFDGLLVPPLSPQLMVASIINILNAEHPNIGLNARKKVEQFSWENNREKWLKILK